MKARSQKLKERYGALYSEADKRVKRNARTHNRLYMDNLRGRATAQQEQGNVFRMTKQIGGGPYTRKYADIRQRARKKMGRTFWSSARQRQPPTKEEIAAAIKELKNGKEPCLMYIYSQHTQN